jgi:glycosyltransferase involved in cell wall biosynthesis
MMANQQTVLAISEFDTQVNKIETHIQPIANAGAEIDYISSGKNSDQTTGITYYNLKKSRIRLFTLFKLFIVSLKFAYKNDYDLVVSYSLLPYGVFALIIKHLTRTPAHLGIIGGDMDVHANAQYSPVIIWLFRRFDVVSVAGTEYEERLQEMGVHKERIYSVFHPVRNEYAKVSVVEEPKYDILWLTRMSTEKDPLLFVEILAELRTRSMTFSAAIVGSGPMEDEVDRALTEYGLNDLVETPGWTDNPVEYYRNARIYVLTSTREMLPLTVVEAMFVGLPPVVPSIGAIPDVVENGNNGIIVDERSVAEYADALEMLLTDEEKRTELGKQAQEIESQLSYEAVANTWSEIFQNINDK